MSMTLGSLFDGSGGFPLAATMCGIIPVWASEVEPYPIAVTRSRFPNMKHLGDVSKVNGAEKDDFTDDEYQFWLGVRNTHAAINGKAERQYTKEQMLAWYNKLHTDSAEYRIWGNGIALPTALYVMQGIAEELTNDVI